MPFLAAFPVLSSVLAFILGTILGSFGNVLVSRLPTGEVPLGRSHCPRCRHTLSYAELVPLLSFCLLRGRCRHCRQKISFQYPLVEIGSGLLFVLSLWHAQFFLLPSLLLSFALWLLLLIAVMDAQTGYVADVLTVPLILLTAVSAFVGGSFPIVAFLLGGGFFALQWIVSRGRWVGSGDILVGAAMGLLLRDAQLLLVALGAAYILGAALAAVLIATGAKTRRDRLPFVPFLAIGTLIALLGGERILQWYR